MSRGKPVTPHYGCVGGPLDGLRARPAPPRALVWFDLNGRAYRAPADGRLLYRFDGTAWTFVGYGARQCTQCASDINPTDNGAAVDICPLCGGKTFH